MEKNALSIILCIAFCLNLAAQSQDKALDSLYYSLPESMVTGERPIVKADKGKLVYDLPHIIRNLPVDNAYDAIKELPGVIENDGSFSLAGKGAKVVIDGKVTNMTQEQLNTLLKSIPSSSIANAEVMYSAPARYQVRGAMINITLKKAEASIAPVQGEAGVKWQYRERHSFEERASVIFTKGKFSGDVLYSHNHGKTFSEDGSESHHTLNDGSFHKIINSSVSEGKGYTHNWRAGADCNIAENHSISGVYTGAYSEKQAATSTAGTYNAISGHFSINEMHNVRIDYNAPFGLSAGAEMTFYRKPVVQSLSNTDGSGTLTANDNQSIISWKAFLSQEHNTKNGWGINYGIIFNASTDDSWQKYSGTGALPDDMASLQKESILNIYAGFSKSFNNQLMLDVSLAGERYRSTIWKKWDIYPNAVLVYAPVNGHLFQFSLSSNRNYPEYWAVKNATGIISGGYSEIIGNPDLAPSDTWQTQFVYLFKNKYMLAAWFSHTRDYFVQTQYLAPDRLKSIFKFVNFDCQQHAGIQVNIPFKIGKWLDSRLTLTGLYQHEKDSDFYDISFDRHKVYAVVHLNNNITISRKPNLLLNVQGSYHSAAIQGIYDLPQGGNLDLHLTWRFNQDRASLTAGCHDVLKTASISPLMNYGNQIVYNRYPSYRSFNVTFSYRFGGYKEKQRKAVDISRFR